MAQIDADGIKQLEQNVKTPLSSIYDKLSKEGNFNLIKDEFDWIMSFINNDVGSKWEQVGATEPTVIINNRLYKAVEQ
mgnify:CR=1 FL=1